MTDDLYSIKLTSFRIPEFVRFLSCVVGSPPFWRDSLSSRWKFFLWGQWRGMVGSWTCPRNSSVFISRSCSNPTIKKKRGNGLGIISWPMDFGQKSSHHKPFSLRSPILSQSKLTSDLCNQVNLVLRDIVHKNYP